MNKKLFTLSLIILCLLCSCGSSSISSSEFYAMKNELEDAKIKYNKLVSDYDTLLEKYNAIADEQIEKSPDSEKIEMTYDKTTEVEKLETTNPTDDVSIGMKNALAEAISYLDFQSFSKPGLKRQLAFEKYTDEEIQYAIDNCGADWKEQCVKSAKTYLDISSYSKDGLKRQLAYDGFEEDEIEYAIEKVYK